MQLSFRANLSVKLNSSRGYLVEVVEDSHAGLSSLPVVGLPLVCAAGVGPVVEGGLRVRGGELRLVGGPVKSNKNDDGLTS